jgi:hypothetical protein
MSKLAKQLLQRMLKDLGLSQHAFGRMIGRSERAINEHVNQGVIPMTQTEFYINVLEIRTQPGYAVITIGMPSTTPVATYRRQGA